MLAPDEMLTDEGSRSLGLRAAKVMPGGANSNFRLSPPRRFWKSGSGARLVDVDGNEFVDYVLGMGTAILGHSPRAVLDRVVEAQARLQCPGGQQFAEIELAETIVELVPCADLVRIGCTGTEMDQIAIRLARAATQRTLVVKFEGHYHGWLDNIYSSTVNVEPRNGSQSARPASPQSAGQSVKALEDLVLLPWNDLEALRTFLTARGSEVAALIMEPVLCNTSVITPQPGYLEGVRQLCDEHGVVLIFDEVITGFRLGLGGAQGRLGVTPDLTVLAKSLGAGFPVAALAGRARLMDLIGNGTVMHGGTYNGNAMCLAAAQATLDIMTDPAEDFHSRLDAMTQHLVDGLNEVSMRHGGAMHVQGIGPVINATFSPPRAIVDYDSYHASDIARQQRMILLLDQIGVRVTGRGTWFVSAAHTKEDIVDTLNRVEIAMARLDEEDKSGAISAP
jgi:glutamate-1-semialdehyde 2,1-aminomutase